MDTNVLPTQQLSEKDVPTPKTSNALENWWQRHNIVNKLLGNEKHPNEEANTLPSGAD